ncbi:Leucine zipper protein 2 [Liparis tanakae]|uniref:Leucine zipper protein 2 n=1 Tax=Liparis tanakae TaxID=230148 RepID=A0A4Z2GYQ8_9TELE|nr:Leucine zipper protein 2 [Liparis tanakae]
MISLIIAPVEQQSYDGLGQRLKEVFGERSSILHQLSKTSKELDSIKGNLQVGSASILFEGFQRRWKAHFFVNITIVVQKKQKGNNSVNKKRKVFCEVVASDPITTGSRSVIKSLKNDDSVAKKDVQRILELSHKQRQEMKSLQAALQKQLDEANERAEKQQATIKFLKVEMEKKTKIIKDLQQEVRGSLFMKMITSAAERSLNWWHLSHGRARGVTRGISAPSTEL